MTVDPSGYLPPHELRALGASLVDHDVDPTAGHAAGHPPGPDLATTSSPGLATAAAAPTGLAPTVPVDDPGALATVVAQLAGELFGGSSLLPAPAPQHAAIGFGLASPVSPGLSPELAAAEQSDAQGPPHSGPTSPRNTPGPTSTAEPDGAAGTISAAQAVAALQALGGEVRIPFAPGGDLAGLPVMNPSGALLSPVIDPTGGPAPGLASLDPRSAASPPGVAMPRLPSAFDVPMPAIERLPLLDGATGLGGAPRGGPDRPIAPEAVRSEAVRVEPIDAPEAPTSSAARGGSAVRRGGGEAFDPHAVRRDFPLLQERVHGGKRLVWLDNAATTQKPHAVIDRLTYFYEHENSNVHRAAHVLAARATDAYESARDTTRKFLNAPSASEIVFVRGATEGINLIAKAWGARHVERGDEIVVTHLEHHANIVPWQQLCAAAGARLRVAPVDEHGDVILDAYEQLLCSRTRLVAFTQVSNALGTVTPAREMIEIAHRWGATVVLDGAQAVSHMPVDVQALDCDFYVFSGHKVFAPTGIGAVFGKRALLDAMPPWQGGGNMIADVAFERTLYQQPPWRFEAGTGNIADAAGLGAALDYVLRIGMPTIERYEHELLGYATERLATVPGLRMVGTPRHQAGVLSFVLDGQRTEDIGAALDRDGIAVRSGHHCAQPILRRYGLESTVRASLAFYNTHGDIDALVASLKRIQAASA